MAVTAKGVRMVLIVTLVALAAVGLWLQDAPTAPAAEAAEARPTPGSLGVVNEKGETVGLCPLKHTDVRSEISGFVARVEVTQQFHNPYEKKIEAVYTFPLSQNAAVDDMVMRVGDREIRGEIKRREEARHIYEAAKAAGHVASLLDQERPNIFTQSVANIMPGQNVDVTIRYVEVLKYEDGWFEFSFPTVVGPRYIPGGPTSRQPEVPPELQGKVVQPEVPQGSGQPQGSGWSPDTDQVADASRVTPQVTAPGTRAGHDLSIGVTVDAGAPVRDIESKLHEVVTQREGDVVSVRLKDKATIPNKDFILRYTTASDEIGDAVLVHSSDLGRFFALILQPPKRVRPEQVTPKEMVFVQDTSGSTRGAPIETSKQTMWHCLANLNPQDTFNLITFSGATHILFDRPVPATEENIALAQAFLERLEGSGGTEMMTAIRAALEPSDSQEHVRIVCFMTDGFVGNDMAIVDEVQKHPNARVFSFGIGQSPNRFLLDQMAEAGRGEAEYVTLGSPGEEVAKRFYERMRNPVLTDIEIDWGSLPVEKVYPKQIRDLFSSKPVVVYGQVKRAARGEVTLRGKVAGQPFARKVHVVVPQREPRHDVLGPMWARQKIQYLMSQDWAGIQQGKPSAEIKDEITGLGLQFRLMTQYTSFVAVEWMTITEGGQARTVPVPVEMPEGVTYEGVFGEGGPRKLARASAAPATAMAGVPLQLGVLTIPSSRAAGPGGMPGMAGPAGPAGAYVGRGYGGGYGEYRPSAEELAAAEARMTPEQKREFRIKTRLAPELQGLAERVAKEGRNGNLTVGSIEVKDGQVKVTIWLSDDSEASLARLKELGFKLMGQAKSAKMVIGALQVGKLEEVALLDFVRGVDPAPATGDGR